MADLPTPDALRRRIQQISEVGTLPHVMMRILEIIADESSSAKDLADEVASDASLTVKILKIVNSAFYGFYREIALISDAVVVLGFEEIKRISLAISIVGMFGAKSPRDERRLAFWHHCFHAAAMADLLEREYGRGGQGAFTAGLLHDIGQVLLDQQFPDVFITVLAHERETGQTPIEAEQALLGVSHAEIGFWLADQWNLPPRIADAIRYHHTPTAESDDPVLTALTHLADVLVHELEDQRNDRPPSRVYQPEALEIIGADATGLAAVRQEMARRLDDGGGLVVDLVTP